MSNGNPNEFGLFQKRPSLRRDDRSENRMNQLKVQQKAQVNWGVQVDCVCHTQLCDQNLIRLLFLIEKFDFRKNSTPLFARLVYLFFV